MIATNVTATSPDHGTYANRTSRDSSSYRRTTPHQLLSYHMYDTMVEKNSRTNSPAGSKLCAKGTEEPPKDVSLELQYLDATFPKPPFSIFGLCASLAAWFWRKSPRKMVAGGALLGLEDMYWYTQLLGQTSSRHFSGQPCRGECAINIIVGGGIIPWGTYPCTSRVDLCKTAALLYQVHTLN